MTLAVCLAVSACAAGSSDPETVCIAQASKETEELRAAVAPLLPVEVANTSQTNNSCDSGAKEGWISFEADRSVSGYKLLQTFRDNGWDVIDMPNDQCGACVAGVSKKLGGKVVEVTVVDRSGDTLELTARHP
ncbi:hypothetical protein MTP10_19880 [Nonomuraea sp. 3-1Str]|uniref:hypothetical protein n=1 Tax=Nonomuraea sp. 3-1Str TaxID=2929801 RepID=UPI00286036B5|nr:hypothetical protein [Nonomuraea sp. 3-1Str]MDR8410983.1 hypothetical protein [Nonomuraea sp. 3-1Str]